MTFHDIKPPLNRDTETGDGYRSLLPRGLHNLVLISNYNAPPHEGSITRSATELS